MKTHVQEPAFALENRVELEALCNMLRLGRGFALGFVRINHPSLRERLVGEVRRRLADLEIIDVTLDPGAEADVVSQMENAVAGCRPGATFVYGLDSMLDLALGQSPVMDNLNLNRDYLGRHFPWPIVFWMPEFAMRELSRQAPDFWSWRSGTYHFVGDTEEARARSVSLKPTSAGH